MGICNGGEKQFLKFFWWYRVKVWTYVFLWTKLEQQPSREKTYEICNSMTILQHMAKKSSFMIGSLEH